MTKPPADDHSFYEREALRDYPQQHIPTEVDANSLNEVLAVLREILNRHIDIKMSYSRAWEGVRNIQILVYTDKQFQKEAPSECYSRSAYLARIVKQMKASLEEKGYTTSESGYQKEDKCMMFFTSERYYTSQKPETPQPISEEQIQVEEKEAEISLEIEQSTEENPTFFHEE